MAADGILYSGKCSIPTKQCCIPLNDITPDPSTDKNNDIDANVTGSLVYIKGARKRKFFVPRKLSAFRKDECRNVVKSEEQTIKSNHEIRDSKMNLEGSELSPMDTVNGFLNHSKTAFSRHINSAVGISIQELALDLSSTSSTNVQYISEYSNHHVHLAKTQQIPLETLNSGVGTSTKFSNSDGKMSLLAVNRVASFSLSMKGDMDNNKNLRCRIARGKTHGHFYRNQNPHKDLNQKSIYKCTFESCNAIFPTKKGLKKHAANSGLHQIVSLRNSLLRYRPDTGCVPGPIGTFVRMNHPDSVESTSAASFLQKFNIEASDKHNDYAVSWITSRSRENLEKSNSSSSPKKDDTAMSKS